MPKREHNPAKSPLTEAVETCELLYSELKWAAHTQAIPLVKQQHLQLAVDHINRICKLIGVSEELTDEQKAVLKGVIGKLEKMLPNLPKTVGVIGGKDYERLAVRQELSVIIGTLEGLSET